MASMVTKACSTNSGHPISVQLKDIRNKRKYQAESPLIDTNSLPPIGCPTYEFSAAKFDGPNSVAELSGTCQDPSEVVPGQPKLEILNLDDFQDVVDWSDLARSQLEELLLCNLDTIFSIAIKEVVGFGCTEEVATEAILRSGVCYGSKDMVFNVVDNALWFLQIGERDVQYLPEECFEDLNQMEKYILTELVCVVREVRPSFSTGDAMWCLLICDMNVSLACSIDMDSIKNLAPNSPVSDPKTKAKSPENLASPSKSNDPKESPNLPPAILDKSFCLGGKSQSPDHEAKFSCTKKISGVTKKEYILRQKSLRLEKSSRLYRSKGVNRVAKFCGFGGLLLDKKLKSVMDSGVSVKCTSSKSTKATSIDFPQEKLPKNPSTNDELPLTAIYSELAKGDPNGLNSCGFSFDKSLGQWVPQNNNDYMILKLVPRLWESQDQLQEWTKWANQKVMQAACRLSKDHTELKMLRQEKDEVERLKKEKQNIEESNIKELFEIEHSLLKASGDLKKANSDVSRLEAENAKLRRERELEELQEMESAACFQEAKNREKKTMMKRVIWEEEKVLLREQLVAEKQKVAKLQQELVRAKDVRDQLEARRKQEEQAKNELLAHSILLKEEREQIECIAKSKDEMVKQQAGKNLQRYKDDIEKLEKEILELRSKTDSSKIAALRRGILTDSRTVASHCNTLRTMLDFEELKRERECVVCLSEEISVVFLPCAHQVVCSTCNQMHEKQGLKECPSCREPIKRRISVRYA